MLPACMLSARTCNAMCRGSGPLPFLGTSCRGRHIDIKIIKILENPKKPFWTLNNNRERTGSPSWGELLLLLCVTPISSASQMDLTHCWYSLWLPSLSGVNTNTIFLSQAEGRHEWWLIAMMSELGDLRRENICSGPAWAIYENSVSGRTEVSCLGMRISWSLWQDPGEVTLPSSASVPLGPDHTVGAPGGSSSAEQTHTSGEPER